MDPRVVWIVKHVLPWMAWLVSLFIPGRKNRLALQEARNKAWIMSLVSQVERELSAPGPDKSLQELVQDCYDMGLFPALWAVEGLGNFHAERSRERSLPLEKLLTDPSLDDLPRKSMTMLHAGIGLSFAKRSLEGLNPDSNPPALRAALEKFIQLCDGSSRKGYAGAAYESLGLVALILHSPEMARVMDRLLQTIKPAVAEFMWRGAGRALYFHPKNFIPGLKSPWRGIAMCKAIAPHATAYSNLRAGIAWATTVVNMRHPQIMESVLLHQGENHPDRDYFVDGVISSLLMRFDTSPDDPNIQTFVRHEPDASNPLLAKLWERDIQAPCRAALEKIYPVLVREARLEELFRYKKPSKFLGDER